MQGTIREFVYVLGPLSLLAALAVAYLVALLRAGRWSPAWLEWRPADVIGPADPMRQPIWLDRPPMVGRWLGCWAWTALALVAMLISNLALVLGEGTTDLVPSMIAKTACIALIPMTCAYSRHLVHEWLACFENFVVDDPDGVRRQFSDQFLSLFSSPGNWGWGVLLGVAIVWFERADGAFDQRSAVAQALVVTCSLIMTTLAGVALGIMIRGSRLIRSLGRHAIYVSASPYGVLSTGRTLVRAFAAITAVYLVAVSTAPLRWPCQATPAAPLPLRCDLSLPILLWVGVVAVAIVGSFVASQWTIHDRMVAFKRDRLRVVEGQLRRALAAFDTDPGRGTHDTVEALRKRRDEIEALPDWPFSRSNLTSVAALALSSMAPAVLRSLPKLLANLRDWSPGTLSGV